MTTSRTNAAPRRTHWLGLALVIAAIAGLLAVAQPAKAQSVESVAPTSGSAAGGYNIVITGEDFNDPVSVTIGGEDILAADFVDADDTSITVLAPAHAPGQVDVVVTTEAGTDTLANGFRYLPAITSIDPDEGTEAGGTEITIEGVGFLGASGVIFDGIPGTDFSVTDDSTIEVTTPPGNVGTSNVIVQHPGGNSPAGTFTYLTAAPAVTSVVPNEGPTAGGTVVTITGTDFTGVTAVNFGVTPATSFEPIDDTTIEAVAPPVGVAGVVSVRVVTPAGMSPAVAESNFTYTTGGPVITILDPDEGPTAGGTVVTITGAGLEDATAVMFGDTAGTDLDVVSDTEITVTSPAHDAGTVFVIIETDGGDSSPTIASQFTFVEGPDVTGINPDEGPAAGGTEVTITGTGFTEDSEVTFGDQPAADVEFVDETEIIATSPAGDPGAVQVVVTTGEVSSAEGDDSEFTYIAEDVETISYTLIFRWTLISWLGIDGITVTNALSGTENPNNPDTNSIAGQVTAIYTWDAPLQRWRGNFPNAGNVPGANDFTTLEFGTSYFIAITGPGSLNWTVLAGP